jgi:anti-sigma B factor antagonist
MSLKVRTRKRGDVLIIEPVGEISGNEVAKLQRKLEEIQKDPGPGLAVDFGNTSFIDSHGLGMLIFLWRQLEQVQCRLSVICPAGFVHDILTNANLQKIVHIVESEDQL